MPPNSGSALSPRGSTFRRFDKPVNLCYSRSMLRRGVLKFICLVAFGLLLSDNISDLTACDFSDAACHACSCGPHLVSPPGIAVVLKPAPTFYVSYKPSSYAFLFPESIFRPPCLAT